MVVLYQAYQLQLFEQVEIKTMPIEKKYYAIGEVATILSVNASLIRYWESQFADIRPRKNKNGVRQYTKEDIEVIKKIHFLIKKRGFTLQGAKEELAKQKRGDKMQKVLAKLKNIEVGLKEIRSQLD